MTKRCLQVRLLIGLISLAAGSRLQEGAIAHPKPLITGSTPAQSANLYTQATQTTADKLDAIDLPDSCQIFSHPDPNEAKPLKLTISFKKSAGSRIQVRWTAKRGLERFRKDLEKALNQATTRKEFETLLNHPKESAPPADQSPANSPDPIGEFLATLLLNTGYITSEVIKPVKIANETITFTVSAGQLVEIHPWQIKTGEIKIVLKKNQTEIVSVDKLITETLKLKREDIRSKLNEIKSSKLQTDSSDEKVKPVREALNELLSRSGHLTTEFQLKYQEEQEGTAELPASISMTFELTLRKQLNQAEQTYICRRIQRGVSYPLNANEIEDQLRLLREDPALESVEGILKESRSGKCPSENQPPVGNSDKNLSQGRSCMEVKVVKSNPVTGGVGVDNYSPPSVGSVRAGADLQIRRVLGFGDEFGVAYFNSLTGGNELFDINYRVPVNRMNGTLQLRTAQTRNRVTQREFEALEIRGKSELYEVSYRQPIVRTPQNELALSVGFTSQNGQTFLFDRLPTPFGIGPDDDGISRTRVLKVGADYLKRSRRSALSLRSQLNIGTGLFDATTNDAPTPDGHFFSWLGQVQWLQKWRRDHLLVLQAEMQLTPDSLLPSQQFVIGGGQSIRGYQQNARSGDNGFRISIENRISIWNRDISSYWRDRRGYLPAELEANPKPDRGCSESFQDLAWSIAPFVEAGKVWNQSNNPNAILGNRLFASVGVGLLLEVRPLTSRICPEVWSFRLDFGYPLIRSETRGNDLQDVGVYFNLRYRF